MAARQRGCAPVPRKWSAARPWYSGTVNQTLAPSDSGGKGAACQIGARKRAVSGPRSDIAILERRFDDVVALYGKLRQTKRWGLGTDQAVADAVAATHPQAALDIWRFIVDSLIAQVKPKSYEEAAVYLRRMCRVYSRMAGCRN